MDGHELHSSKADQRHTLGATESRSGLATPSGPGKSRSIKKFFDKIAVKCVYAHNEAKHQRHDLAGELRLLQLALGDAGCDSVLRCGDEEAWHPAHAVFDSGSGYLEEELEHGGFE